MESGKDTLPGQASKAVVGEPPLHGLVYRFRRAARVLVSLVTAAFLLASLASAANAYPALSSCSRHADHFTPNSAGSIGHPVSHQASHPTSQQASHPAHHHDADADKRGASDACCGTCDHCNGYFEAHLQGLNFAAALVPPLASHPYVSTPSSHSTDFVSRPYLPPPKSAFVFR